MKTRAILNLIKENASTMRSSKVKYGLLKVLTMVLLAVVVPGSCKNHRATVTTKTVDVLKPIERDLTELRKQGKLTVLVGNSSSSYFIYRGRPMGFEYELLERLAKHLDLELEVVIPDDMNDVFDMLNRGEGDMIAASLTITKERAKTVDFTEYLMQTRQVLVQRKPENWRRMSWNNVRRGLIRNQLDLIDKTVHVRRNSSYYSRLVNLSDELGGDIQIETVSGDVTTEELIKMVALGEIEYTVVDEHIAELNATYYSDIDIGMPISFPQRLAWAVRKNSPALKEAIDQWMLNERKTSDYHHIVKKYYKNRKAYMLRSASGYHSQFGGRISIYDETFKQHATESAWDWRLIASIAYQESKFNNDLVSWAGAMGLMQMMPETARRFGGDSLMTPEKSIITGIRYLNYLNAYWIKHIPDSAQRMPFVLSSYNAGLGHVIDARNLCEKYGNDMNNWDAVSYFLLNKSQRRFYKDKVVKHGYCRGEEPVKYVTEILGRYQQYQKLIPLALSKQYLLAASD